MSAVLSGLSGCVKKSDLYQYAADNMTISTAQGIDYYLTQDATISASGNNAGEAGSSDTINGIPISLMEEPAYTMDGEPATSAAMHFLDMESSACCIVMNGGHMIIINTGSSAYEDKFFYYIQRLAPVSIDMILTCTNEALAGNAVRLIDEYHSLIGTIIIPPYISHNDSIGSSIIDEVYKYELSVSVPESGKPFFISGYKAVMYRPYTTNPSEEEDAETVLSFYAGGQQYVFELGMSGEKEKDLISYHSFDTETPCAAIMFLGSGPITHASSVWLNTLKPLYAVIPTRDAVASNVLQRLIANSCGILYSFNRGTMLFNVSDTGIEVTTHIVDYDVNEDLKETEAPEPEYHDMMVYLDEDGVCHSSLNCNEMVSDNFSSIRLSVALDQGNLPCKLCMEEGIAGTYEAWKAYHATDSEDIQ